MEIRRSVIARPNLSYNGIKVVSVRGTMQLRRFEIRLEEEGHTCERRLSWRAVSFPNGRRERFRLHPRPGSTPAPLPQPGMPQAAAIENLSPDYSWAFAKFAQKENPLRREGLRAFLRRSISKC